MSVKILVLAVFFFAYMLVPKTSQAVTTYHAFIVANDGMVESADLYKNALLNWDSWKGTNEGNKPKITVVKNRLGTVLIQDITDWITTENMDDDDVIVFMYSGHGGEIPDQAPPDLAADELALLDPEFDNDDARDNLNRRKKFDETISVWPFGKGYLARDDKFYEVLQTLPIGATKLFVFGMCGAAGECRGAHDPDGVTNATVMVSVCEGCIHPEGPDWEWALEKGLFDTDNDGFAEADVNHDNKITIQEWYAASKIAFSGHPQLCSPPSPDALPIVVGLGNPQLPRTDLHLTPGSRGVNGCGVCSIPDFGDAPDDGMICNGPTGPRPRYYKTTLANDGPRYNEWVSQWLGPYGTDSLALTTVEPDGQSSCGANADSIGDDGVLFGSSSIDVTVTVVNSGPLNYRLDAWWDLDDNGRFDQPSEHLIDSRTDFDGLSGGKLNDLSGTPGSTDFHYALPFDPRIYYSRFRLTFGVPLSTEILPTGEYTAEDGASHGEAEDYFFTLGACCQSGSTCMITTQADCTAQNDYYVGDGTTCSQCDLVGVGDMGRPTWVGLSQPLPNPSSGAINFTISLARPAWTKIGLFDQSGRLVARITDHMIPQGVRQFSWRTLNGDLPSGIYFLRLQANDQTFGRKVVFLR